MKFRKFIKQFKPGEDVNIIYHGINVYTGPVANLPEIYSMGMHDVVTSEIDKEMPLLNVEIENSSYEESETLFVRAEVLYNYQDGRMRVALLASGADGITFTTDDKSLIKLGEIEEEIRERVGRELIKRGSNESSEPIGFDGRHEERQLVELPKKHGRLIDADALIAEWKDVLSTDGIGISPMFAMVVAGCIRDVERAKVIVEAEAE